MWRLDYKMRVIRRKVWYCFILSSLLAIDKAYSFIKKEVSGKVVKFPNAWKHSSQSNEALEKTSAIIEIPRNSEVRQAPGWWIQRLSGVLEAGPPQGHRVVVVIPGITSWHHHVQSKEKAIFRTEEAFRETPWPISPPVSLAGIGHMFFSEHSWTSRCQGQMGVRDQRGLIGVFSELGLGCLLPPRVKRKNCLPPPGPERINCMFTVVNLCLLQSIRITLGMMQRRAPSSCPWPFLTKTISASLNTVQFFGGKQ